MTATLAASITKAASKQTYYTIRFLVDRGRVEDAYRAYGYFRWVDDLLDSASGTRLSQVQAAEREAFLARQQSLLGACYRERAALEVNAQEKLLVELVQTDHERNSGLHLYLTNMMRVMNFDVERRGRLISQMELNEYTRWLATAVMECIHHFIGHGEYAPHDATRYLAVAGAHISHMLRDTFEDARIGYYNIPREVLEENHIGPEAAGSDAYRAWVKERVQLAREYFKAGKSYLARVQNARCRLACFAYIARFEWLLDTIEKEGYCLRPHYAERKGAGAGLRMSWLTLASLVNGRGTRTSQQPAFPRAE